jgi:molybdate transport repressor ModE-like protein
MSSARDVLTPDALTMLQTIARHGSFAAAARDMGVVPSALSYRVRQMEEALDVLLFNRASRQAKLTAAGHELLSEGHAFVERHGQHRAPGQACGHRLGEPVHLGV